MLLHIRKEKMTVGILLYMIVFQSVIEIVFPLMKFFDEIFSVGIFLMGIIIWLHKKSGTTRTSMLIPLIGLMIFNVMGWISAFFTGYRSIEISVLSWFLSNKFFLTVVGVYFISCCCNLQNIGAFARGCARPLLTAVSLWQVLSLTFWDQMAIPTLEICADSVFLMALIFSDWRGAKDIVFALIATVLLLTSQTMKAYGAVLLIAAIIVWILLWKRKVGILEIIAGLAFVIVFAWKEIYYYYIYGAQVGFPRAMLMTHGAIVATSRFPLGTGWGTFGSHYAAEMYSPVYVELGWENHYTVGQQRTFFLNDTFWPTIYTETGWIGFAGFILFLGYSFYRIHKCYSHNRKLYAAGILVFGYMMVTTLESTAFSHPALACMALIWGSILCYRKQIVERNME